MAYICELSPGHNIYLDNQGDQTLITSMMSTPGQQQQSSSSVRTGCWTALPEIYRTPQGAVIKLTTAQGEQFIQVQGSSMISMTSIPSLQGSQQIQINQSEAAPSTSSLPLQAPLPPMQPMQPMKMGDMEMGMKPMEMRMGNMHLSMGSVSSESAHSGKTQPTERRFCNQCGVALEPKDRFCSSCGHKLA